MKAMVLAAGYGRRMRPLTLLRAKPALPVLGRPLIHWTLEQLARHGVTDVVVNLHHLPRTIVAAVGDGSRFGLRVRYSREPRILGRGGGPRKVRRFFGDEPFLLVNGDVVFDFDLRGLVARHRASGAQATLALKPNPDPRTYGPVVTGPGGRVRSIAGRPRPARGAVSLFTGVQVLEPALLERLPPGPSDTLTHLYPPLLAEGSRVLGVRVGGAWYDLGSPKTYLAAQLRLLRPRPSLVDPAARVEGRLSFAIVGADSRVEQGASVVRSVLWDGVRVGRGAVVRDSILASGVRVPPGARVEARVVVPGRRGRGVGTRLR